MADEGDSLLALIGGGLLGYLLGEGRYNDWKPVIEQYQKRFQQLTFAQIPLPVKFLQMSQTMRVIYRQSLYAYLFGLPDASLPALIRVLEQALKVKYDEVEGKKPSRDMDLAKLIDWAESYLKDKALIAHSFRRLRNFVHTDNLVQEQDSLEGIRHVSIILESLFSSNQSLLSTVCSQCKSSNIASLVESQRMMGHNVPLVCSHCHMTYNISLMP